MVEHEQAERTSAVHPPPNRGNSKSFVEAGGLLSYGVNLYDVMARATLLLDKILKGAKPSHLPVERPVRFDLAVNLTTAKALGLTIPPSLLLRADQIIE